MHVTLANTDAAENAQGGAVMRVVSPEVAPPILTFRENLVAHLLTL